MILTWQFRANFTGGFTDAAVTSTVEFSTQNMHCLKYSGQNVVGCLVFNLISDEMVSSL